MSVAVQIIEPDMEVRLAMRAIGVQARAAARVLANAPAEEKNRALIWPRLLCASAQPKFWPPMRAISPKPKRRAFRPHSSTG